MDCFVASAPRNDGDCVLMQRHYRMTTELEHGRKTFFIIFVDAMFTTLFPSPFTNIFDVIDANAAIPCVYRAGNAD